MKSEKIESSILFATLLPLQLAGIRTDRKTGHTTPANYMKPLSSCLRETKLKENMRSEILAVIAQVGMFTFIITSMLAMGLSLTVKQIMDPLRNIWVVLLASGEQALELEDPETSGRQVVFDPGGKWIAAGNDEGFITV